MSNFAAKMHSAIRGTKRSVLWFFASCIVAAFASVTLTHAAFNKQLNYQGKLTNASNVAVANGTYNMEFKLYTVSSGGVAIWTETRTGADKVQVTSGLFSVMLGEVNPLTGVNFNQTLYLGVNIGGTGTPSWDGEMTPRKKLGAVPAAVEAENLGGASASQYLRSDIAATSSVTDNTNAAFTIAQLGTGNIFDVLDGATKVLTVLDGGNVGIGDATPAALFTVGNGDLFQVNSSGAIAAATGITTSGNVVLKPLGTGAGQTTETHFLELAANGTEYAGFKAPDSLVASIVWTLPSSDSSGCVQSDGAGHLLIASCLAGGGGGTVTSFSAGNLSPLFTTSVSTPSTTPALGFTLSNAAANTWFGNNTGSSAAPSYNAAGTLSKTDDTNVTLTLGGTPAGSLLNSVSITAGWTGQLAVGRGGTGAGTLTANGVLYGNGTSAIGATAAGTNGQILVGVTGGAPAFVSLSGDAAITNTGVLTIGANTVTYAKFQQVAASSIVGNPTGSLANAQGITLGAGLAFSGTSLVTSNIPNASLQNSSITLATGTTGTDVGWGASSVALGGTATLNIPDAGSSARGVVTTGAQTFAGVKTLSSAPIFSSVSDAAGNFLTLNTSTGVVQKRTAAEVLSDIGALSSGASSTQTGYFGDIKLQDDTTPSNYLAITDAENLTADHILSLSVNNADRTVSLSGNLTVSGNANVSGTNTGDITLGTANGLSLAGQALSLQLADATHTGALSSTDWNTFNSKESTLTFGNGLTRTGNSIALGGTLTTATYLNGGSNTFVIDTTGSIGIGDNSASGNSTYLSIYDPLQIFSFYSQGGQSVAEFDAGNGLYRLGRTFGANFTVDNSGSFLFDKGSVGIGTTPSATLDVLATATEPATAFNVDTNAAWSNGDSRLASFKNNGSEKLAITHSGALVSGTGALLHTGWSDPTGETIVSLRDTSSGDVNLNELTTAVSDMAGGTYFNPASNYGYWDTYGSTANWETWQQANDSSGNNTVYDVYTAPTDARVRFQINGTNRMILNPTAADNASAFAYRFDTSHSFVTSGAKLAVFANHGVDKLSIDKDGNITSSALLTGGTAPTTSGTTKMVITDGNGQFSFASAPVPTGTNTGDVTLAGENYLSIAGQVFTANAVNLSGTNVTGTLAAARFGALTGDVTSAGGTYATTIGNNAVTYAKFQQVAASSIVGNPTGSLANAQGITLGAGLAFSGTSLVTSNIPNASLQNSSITVATGTSGTDFNVSGSPVSLGGTVTLNIPDAGTSARGLVTTGTQTFAGNKTVNGNFSVVSNATEPASALTVNTSSLWTNAASRLASFKNNGTEVVGITHNGGIVMGSNVATNWGDPNGEALVALRDTSAGDTNLSEIALATSDKAGGTYFNPASNYGYFDTWGYAGDWRTWQQANNSSGNNTIYDLHTLPTDINLSLQVNGNVKTRLNPTQSDGATAIPFYFNTSTTLATSGAKIVSFQNAGSEKFYVDKDGKGYFAGAIAQAPAAAADLSNYLQTNQANAANTTTLNPGILVYNDGHPWGMDLGYNNSRYRTRIFASDIGDVALSYVSGTNPTGQSNFTDALVVRGDSGGAGNIGINVLTPTSRLDVLNNVTGLAANTKAANFSNAGSTFNTTAGALTSYAGYFSSTSTRSAGTNTLTNVGLYTEASGAQNNYGLIVGAGRVGIGTSTPNSQLTVAGTSGSVPSTYLANSTSIGGGKLVTIGEQNSIWEGLRLINGDSTTGATSRLTMVASVDPFNDTNAGKVFIDAIRTATNMDFAISLNDVAGAAPVERFRIKGSGNILATSLDTDNTAPTTTGTTKMVITDSNGLLSFTNIPAGGSTTLNSILAATATNTINNAAYAQEWQWNSLTTGTGMKLSSTSVSSGSLLDLTVNSTAAASDTQKALNISTSGTNATTGMTTYGAYVSNSHAGTSSTNVAMYLSATGGTSNRALIIPSGGGRVGIGTISPTYLMDVVENSTGFAPSINIANADTSTVSYAQIAFSGSGRTFGVGVGNSTETLNSVANKFFIYDSTTNAMRFVIDTNGSVGIGDTTPNSLFTVGINDAFQINSSGQITNGSITSTFGSINIGANNFTTTGTVFGNTIDRSTVGALLIGSTASSTSICNSTACDTIQIGTNTDADTITIGDTSNLDAITVNGTLTNTNGSGSNSVINLSSTGDFIIQDNGAAFATFNDSGNVGIGVAPTYKFDVLNATTGQTATSRVANFSNAGATFNTTAGALSAYAGYFSATSTRSTGGNNLTNIGLYATASGAQNNYAAIFDQGSVGIGTTTPTNKFQIYSSTNTADILRVNDTGDITANANTYGVSIFGKNTYLSANYPILAVGDTSQATAYGIALEAKNGVYNIPTIQLGFSGSGGALDMWNYRSWQPDGSYGYQFTTKAGSTNSASKRFSITGNADTAYAVFENSFVGIGATTPSNTLTVTGTGSVSGWFGIGTTSQYGTSDFTIGDATDQDLWMAFRGQKADTSEIRLVMGTQGNVGVGNDNAFLGTATGDKFELRTNNTARITILGGGNVGIANGNPSYALHVGTSSISGIVARFENSTGTCDINPTTTSLSCSSDMRLKKNITKLDSENEEFTLNTDLNMQEDTILSKVLAITPVTYNWNSESDSDPRHVGFIAQEVEQVFPDLVSTDDQGRKSLNYIGLVPYTIKAVQEMNVRIAALPEFEDQTMAQKVADFLRGIAERGEAVISSIKAQRVHTEELCVGSEGDEVCVTKDQLQNLLNNSSASAGGTPTPAEPTPPTEQGTDTNTGTDMGMSENTTTTDGTGTTDSGTTDTSATGITSTPAADTSSSSDTSSI